MNIYYNDDYTSSDYSFDTTRKSAAVAEWLNTHALHTSDPSGFYELTERIISQVHSPDYVNAVKTGKPIDLAESQGFTWDSQMYRMALAHSAGLVAATHDVFTDRHGIAGSLSSGLHHSSKESGAGFCTFNGLAVAATAAHHLGARNILCLDFDAHCGGGTYSMTRDINVTQIDVSTSMFDNYYIYEDDKSRLFDVPDPQFYLDEIDIALAYAERLGGWDFVIYNAGMDPYNTSVSKSDLMERERMVAQFVHDGNYPTIFALAGGYTWGNVTMDELVELHTQTALAMLGATAPNVG